MGAQSCVRPSKLNSYRKKGSCEKGRAERELGKAKVSGQVECMTALVCGPSDVQLPPSHALGSQSTFCGSPSSYLDNPLLPPSSDILPPNHIHILGSAIDTPLWIASVETRSASTPRETHTIRLHVCISLHRLRRIQDSVACPTAQSNRHRITQTAAGLSLLTSSSSF